MNATRCLISVRRRKKENWLIVLGIVGWILNPSWAAYVMHDGAWNLPQPHVPDEKDVLTFEGNQTVKSHFHQIYLEEDSVLIAARNLVFNVSTASFTEASRLIWYSNETDVQRCMLKQRTAEECQNYIRVIIKLDKDRLLICGTNAFFPLCRTYSSVQFQKRGCSSSPDGSFGTYYCEESGVARCPYDPLHNSSAVHAGNRLFFATVADVSARDSLIFSSPLRTEQHDSQWLNDPNFVSSFEYGDKVYFFFREMAIENINCGKAVFSRVARVCTNDAGGERVLRNTWTSFFKARLNCSIPGEFPFYFDEIYSTSALGNGNVFPTLILNDRVPMVYGVFTTPRNSLRGSAICAYRFSDIIATFEGPFKEQRTAHSNWLPVRESDAPSPHPAKSCFNDSSTLSDQTLNFIKWHPLMDRAVPAFGGQPVIIQASFNYSFTQVAVDWQVYAADHRYYDVLFIGTDNGHVLKVINKGRSQQMETEVIEILKVFPDNDPVISLKIHHSVSTRQKKLIILSKNKMRSLPLHRCYLKTSCSACVALKDPYCSWINGECVDSDLGLQSIETGRHAKCHETETVSETTTKESTTLKPTACLPCQCAFTSADGDDTTILISEQCQASVEQKSAHYSSSTLALAVVLSIVLSLITGFTVGYCFGKQNHYRYSLGNTEVSSYSLGRTEKVLNDYEIDATPRHTCTERCSALAGEKRCNIYANEHKENNAHLRNDMTYVAPLDRRKSSVVCI